MNDIHFQGIDEQQHYVSPLYQTSSIIYTCVRYLRWWMLFMASKCEANIQGRVEKLESRTTEIMIALVFKQISNILLLPIGLLLYVDL